MLRCVSNKLVQKPWTPQVLQKIEDRAATVRWSEADRSTGLPTLHRDRKRDVLGRQRGCFVTRDSNIGRNGGGAKETRDQGKHQRSETSESNGTPLETHGG